MTAFFLGLLVLIALYLLVRFLEGIGEEGRGCLLELFVLAGVAYGIGWLILKVIR